MIFWIAAGAIAVAAAALIASRLLFSAGRGPGGPSDVEIYREQLRDLDRDLARGVVTEAEAEAVRLEISRRLLDADRAARGDAPIAGRGPSRLAAALAAVVVAGGAVGLYAIVGRPGFPDLPIQDRIEAAAEARATRPGQEVAEAEVSAQSLPPPVANAEYLELVERLRAAVAARPDDLEGHILLARNEARLGRFSAARAAQEQVIAIKGSGAGADDWAGLADLMILAAGGYVSLEAEAAIARALDLDPGNGTARYYSGLMFAQTGRPDLAFRTWRRLLDDSTPDAPWVPPIRAQIEDLAQLAGVRYELPPLETRGPSAADIEAAGDMTEDQRQDMIRGMVAGLADRLATEGGPPEDWARLIRAYGVLGDRDAAAAIWAEAQAVFPDDGALDPIRDAARAAGVAE